MPEVTKEEIASWLYKCDRIEKLFWGPAPAIDRKADPARDVTCMDLNLADAYRRLAAAYLAQQGLTIDPII